MNFQQWLENLEGEQHASSFPASAEVIRTGLQPQVDAEEINTKEKEAHDKVLAIDGQMQRLQTVADQINLKQSDHLKKIKAFLDLQQKKWDQLKSPSETGEVDGFRNPSDAEVEYLKKQPPLSGHPNPIT